MKKGLILSGLGLVIMANGATAQTTVTNSNNGTSGTVPAYTGSATVGNSPITVSNGNVAIGPATTAPSAPLDVWSNNIGSNNGYSHLAITSPVGSPNTDNWGDSELTLDINNPLAPHPTAKLWSIGSGEDYNSDGTYDSAVFWIWSDFSNGVPNIMIDSSNNVGIGGTGMNSSGTPAGASLFVQASGNVGIGTSSPAYALDVAGQIHTSTAVTFPDGSHQTTAWTGTVCGGDYAESVDAAEKHNLYAPGDVLVLTSDGKGDVEEASEPYSTMVAGIYATKPGVVGRRISLPKSADDVPMALIGIVPTKVSAENGSIRRGDLLVSSSTPGYAMKGTDRNRMLGAVVGKAMGSLESGKGVIEVLVTLQ